jgi:hypothetical protein
MKDSDVGGMHQGLPDSEEMLADSSTGTCSA